MLLTFETISLTRGNEYAHPLSELSFGHAKHKVQSSLRSEQFINKQFIELSCSIEQLINHY